MKVDTTFPAVLVFFLLLFAAVLISPLILMALIRTRNTTEQSTSVEWILIPPSWRDEP